MDLWIGYWTSRRFQIPNADYILMYLSIAVALLFFLIYRSIIFGYGVAEAGYRIFFQAFDNLVRRPIQFFDTTPVGQILGRLVND